MTLRNEINNLPAAVGEGSAGHLGNHRVIHEALKVHDADIQAAMASADTTSATVRNVEARVSSVEAMGGLSPQSPVDGQTANLIYQSDSLTHAAVNKSVSTSLQDPLGQIQDRVSLLLAERAHQMILDQAEADGWLAVYDPGNPTTRTVVDGKITSIADGLGNMPDLSQSDIELSPRLLLSAYGSLTAMGEVPRFFLRSPAFSSVLEQPTMIMALARTTHSSGNQVLFDGVASGRQSILRTPSGGYSIYAGAQSPPLGTAGGGHHIFTAGYGPELSTLWIDGERAGDHPAGERGLDGLTVGERYAPNGTHWRGSIGPVLIYPGEADDGVRLRMEQLLTTLSETWVAPKVEEPRLDTAAGIAVMDEAGNLVYGEDPDTHRVPASTLKLMSAYVARKTITDARLEDPITAAESFGPIAAGRAYSAREMFYSSLLPSSNAAANSLADYAGELLLDGAAGDPRERFMQEMHTVGESLGWSGNVYLTPSGSQLNQATPRSMADLMRRIVAEDPFLHEVSGTQEYTLHTNVKMTHSITPYLDQLPGWTGGKTGTLLANQECLVGTWTTTAGKQFFAAVLASESGKRYADMGWLINQSNLW